ncbi:MAG: hypothetical protein IPM29_29540 [Planctomycetes bacterium]|nr:hypothetical protein [Planctomycetota bacterium]
MNRRRRTVRVGAAIAVAAAGVTFYAVDDLRDAPPLPRPPARLTPAPGGRARELAELRRSFDLAALDRYVAALRASTERDAAAADAWRALGEALLERCLMRDRNKGMAPGRPTHDELPPDNAADIAEGLAAVQRAIDLGEPTGDAWRVRAALLSLSITGFGDLLTKRPRASEALDRAAALDPGNPRVLLMRASERLFAPRFLGFDPADAIPTLERVAEELTVDERPLVTLAFAHWLAGDLDAACHALERALERNPANRYAREVLRRLYAGEDEPFARDVPD